VLLEDFHETRDIELGVQGQIVDVCNECSDLLLETMESLFESVVRLVRVVAFIISQVIFRTAIVSVRIMLVLLAFDI